eukprot:TRINITY_DN21226_c0_g1_i1.p1 TRINITY_DN21226_c0_g1~~TRINITY_DN21226_c0_g1_i1.p1  ORF type:complete len:272 (+),score=-6.54 TRINITY_DN21226_c0_g1_i1:32-817(+)
MYRDAGKGDNLYKCAVGYAAFAGVTGGLNKPLYIVTNNLDNPLSPIPGSLRYGLDSNRHGVTVRFNRSMAIVLKEILQIRSDTTIDGRGARVNIVGAMLVRRVSNVIIHNIRVGDAKGDTDLIHVRGSKRVWVDHCTLMNAYRGTVDVVYGSTNVTISNCYLQNKKFTMLLGAADNYTADKNMRVTVYRNWFHKCGQRQPHVRWGFAHVVNNLNTGWTQYAVGGRVHANIRSEKNVRIHQRYHLQLLPPKQEIHNAPRSSR